MGREVVACANGQNKRCQQARVTSFFAEKLLIQKLQNIYFYPQMIKAPLIVCVLSCFPANIRGRRPNAKLLYFYLKSTISRFSPSVSGPMCSESGNVSMDARGRNGSFQSFGLDGVNSMRGTFSSSAILSAEASSCSFCALCEQSAGKNMLRDS